MDPETEVVEPVVETPVEAVVELVIEPVAEPERAPPPKWALERISEETRKRQEADARVAAAERRAQDAEALATRIQAGQQPPPEQQRQQQIEPDPTAVDRAVSQRLMNDARQEIIRNGYATFGGAKFDETANILGAVGCVSDDFISDVLAVDRANAHKMLADLAAKPEDAARIARLDSRSRIAELTRMTMASAVAVKEPEVAPKIAPKTVSKAPAPAPVVEPSASKIVDWRSDEASDDDFTKGFEETMKKRAGRR